MSDSRKRARDYLTQVLDSDQDMIMRTSRYYPPEESWTAGPACWHELPLSKIRDSRDIVVHILCEKENGEGFHHLQVPASYLLDNLSGLCLRGNKLISLFLSADSRDQFTDLRGHGKIKFQQWLV